MPLNIKIECAGEKHVIAVFAKENDHGYYELEAEITHPGHDYAYDFGAHEFGYALPRCYEIQEVIESGFDNIFIDEELREAFLQALAIDDAKSLGMEREDFVQIVIDFIEDDRLEGGSLLGGILADLPWFKETSVFRDSAHDLAKLAYDNGDNGLFYIVNKLYGGGLIRVEEEDDEENSETGTGYSINRAKIKVFIGDDLVDEWSFGFIGWFCTPDLYSSGSWHVERVGGSGSASPETDDFLRTAGFEGCSDGIEKWYRPEEPELPNCFDSGDWALMCDGYLWGRFKTEDEAYWIYDAIREGSWHGRGAFGVELTILHRIASLEKPEHTGERWKNDDPEDETIWEIVTSDGV